MKRRWFFYAILMPLFVTPLRAAVLTIESKDERRTFSQTELLRHKSVETFKNYALPAHRGETGTYQAVPLWKLFEGMEIGENQIIQFHCADGFSAPISKPRLLNRSENSSIAYIAIEDPKQRWKPVTDNPSLGSPGPFYLIWKNPEKSKIATEEWPYQLTRFVAKTSFEKSFPKTLPSTKFLGKSHPIERGFRVFRQNCFACHTMNGQGFGSIGPDLNIPMNPTEYLKEKALRQLIRDPQSVRKWANSRMVGFSADQISSQDLNHLVSYLKHMAERKDQTP